MTRWRLFSTAYVSNKEKCLCNSREKIILAYGSVKNENGLCLVLFCSFMESSSMHASHKPRARPISNELPLCLIVKLLYNLMYMANEGANIMDAILSTLLLLFQLVNGSATNIDQDSSALLIKVVFNRVDCNRCTSIWRVDLDLPSQ